MPLPKLPKLKRVRAEPVRRVSRSANEIVLKDPPLEEQYKPYPPFNSSWEVYIWNFLRRQHPNWEVQQTFGGYRMKGSTRVDFLNRVLGIAFYPDGTYWHAGERRETRDLVNRAQLPGRGFRVVQWLISDFDQVVRELPTFYRRMVYGS